MRVGGGWWLRDDRSRRFEALGHKLKHRFNLFAGHVEFFHHFLNAEVLEIFEDCGNGQPGVFKHLRTAYFTRNAFHCRTL
jgi:hypothetical protein